MVTFIGWLSLGMVWRKSPSVSSKYGSRGRRSTVVEKATGSDGCLLFRLKGCTRVGFHSQTIVMTMRRDQTALSDAEEFLFNLDLIWVPYNYKL